jgi:N-terminal region of glycosyl transferase group 7
MYMKNNTPKVIFVVPYRDRETQKINFINKMKHLLNDIDRRTYDILFIYQCDNRDFNRTYMYSNMGFYGNYEKNGKCLYGIGDDFEHHELSATCTKHTEYIYDEISLANDKYESVPYFHVCLKLGKKIAFEGFVYNNVNEDKIDNENILHVHYDNKSKLLLYQSL